MMFKRSSTESPQPVDDTVELIKNAIISITQGPEPWKIRAFSQIDMMPGLTREEQKELVQFVKDTINQKQRSMLRSEVAKQLVGEPIRFDMLEHISAIGEPERQLSSKNLSFKNTMNSTNVEDLYKALRNDYDKKMANAQNCHFQNQAQNIAQGMYGTVLGNPNHP